MVRNVLWAGRLAPENRAWAAAPGWPCNGRSVLGMGRRFRFRIGPGASIVLRALLLANGVLLAVVGFMALRYVTRPPGVIVAFGFWIGAIVLWSLMPLTDPYRHERARR